MREAIKVGAFFVIARNNVAGCIISLRTPRSPRQSGSFERKLQARGQENLNKVGSNYKLSSQVLNVTMPACWIVLECALERGHPELA